MCRLLVAPLPRTHPPPPLLAAGCTAARRPPARAGAHAGAALPALLGVLPLALLGGGGATGFARTTVSNATAEPELTDWALLVSVAVAAAVVHAGCEHLDAALRGVRTLSSCPLAHIA